MRCPQKENAGQTFLDTLLNTCQEFYQDRDTLLRSSPRHQPSQPVTHTKWIAYMSFLHEMYSLVSHTKLCNHINPTSAIESLSMIICMLPFIGLASWIEYRNGCWCYFEQILRFTYWGEEDSSNWSSILRWREGRGPPSPPVPPWCSSLLCWRSVV